MSNVVPSYLAARTATAEIESLTTSQGTLLLHWIAGQPPAIQVSFEYTGNADLGQTTRALSPYQSEVRITDTVIRYNWKDAPTALPFNVHTCVPGDALLISIMINGEPMASVEQPIYEYRDGLYYFLSSKRIFLFNLLTGDALKPESQISKDLAVGTIRCSINFPMLSKLGTVYCPAYLENLAVRLSNSYLCHLAQDDRQARKPKVPLRIPTVLVDAAHGTYNSNTLLTDLNTIVSGEKPRNDEALAHRILDVYDRHSQRVSLYGLSKYDSFIAVDQKASDGVPGSCPDIFKALSIDTEGLFLQTESDPVSVQTLIASDGDPSPFNINAAIRDTYTQYVNGYYPTLYKAAIECARLPPSMHVHIASPSAEFYSEEQLAQIKASMLSANLASTEMHGAFNEDSVKCSMYNPTDYVYMCQRASVPILGSMRDKAKVPDLQGRTNVRRMDSLFPLLHKNKISPISLVPGKSDAKFLSLIDDLPFCQRLTTTQKDVLWKYRFWVRKSPTLLLRFAQSIPWADYDLVMEGEISFILTTWKAPKIDQLLTLLTDDYTVRGEAEGSPPGNYCHSNILRKYALNKLFAVEDKVLVEYMFEMSLKIYLDISICVVSRDNYKDILQRISSRTASRDTSEADAQKDEAASIYSVESVSNIASLLHTQGSAQGAQGTPVVRDDPLIVANTLISPGPAAPGFKVSVVDPREGLATPALGYTPFRKSNDSDAGSDDAFTFETLADLLIIRAIQAPYTYYLLHFFLMLWLEEFKSRGDPATPSAKDSTSSVAKFERAVSAYAEIMEDCDPEFHRHLRRTIALVDELLRLCFAVKAEAKGRLEQLGLLKRFLSDRTRTKVIRSAAKQPILFPFLSRRWSDSRSAPRHTPLSTHKEGSSLSTAVHVAPRDDDRCDAPPSECSCDASSEPLDSRPLGLRRAGAGESDSNGEPDDSSVASSRNSVRVSSESYETCRHRFVSVGGVSAEKMYVFKSAKKPFLLNLIEHETGRELPLLIKLYDDVRLDQIIQNLFRLFDRSLRASNLDMRYSPYHAFAVSPAAGFVECVMPSTSIDDILRTKTLVTVTSYLAQQLEEPLLSRNHFHRRFAAADQMENFIRSSSGYSLATYLLAIGDRHGENILIQPDGRLFHIDFGWCFGRDPKRGSPLMKVSKEMIDGFGGVNSTNFNSFLSHICENFIILRKRDVCSMVLCLINMLRGGGITVLDEEAASDFSVIEDKFQLDMSDEDAVFFIVDLVRDCMSAVMPQIIDALHRWVQSVRK